jgi:hypothetical protein
MMPSQIDGRPMKFMSNKKNISEESPKAKRASLKKTYTGKAGYLLHSEAAQYKSLSLPGEDKLRRRAETTAPSCPL